MGFWIVRGRSIQYSIGLSSPNVTVGAPLDVNLRALPNSLALLHAYDSRLEGLLSNTGDSSRTVHLWSFSEFLSPDPPGEQSAESFAWFSNLIELATILAKRKEVCRLAGKLNPQCPLVVTQKGSSPPLLKTSSSRLSDDCLREMEEECERQKSGKERADTLTEMQPREGNAPQMPIKMAGNVHWLVQRPSLKTTPSGMEDVQSLRSAKRTGDEHPEKEKAGEELSLRDFFPEVWLFNDYRIENGSLAVKLNSTPHSVTAWNFVATFWSLGRSDVCKAEKQSLVAKKHVFMDVDVPLHVYVNESVNVHIAVSVVNLTRNEHMSVCFRGLSPKVCGDVGRDGSFGETDFTRVVLTPENPMQLKNFFVRFLRPGTHNLSFELRSEDVLKGHDWHCRGKVSTVFDRISKKIQVERRVDVEEHFRQIVVYRRKRLDEGEEQQITLEQILDSTSATTSTARTSLLASAPDVISYSMQQQQSSSSDRSDQQRSLADLLQTKVSINAGGRKVYNLGVEFSKFVPSFPPALSTELLSVASPLDPRGNAPMHRVRNRPVLNAFSEEESSERNLRSSGKESTKAKERQKRRRMAESSERPLQGYSLPNLLKELAFLTYELKSVRTMLTVGAGAGDGEGRDESAAEAKDGTDREWTEQRELLLGTLLSELLTFSDCEHRHKDCGFGEFGRPKEPTERNLVLTTLATSLLCEQRAAEEYVRFILSFLNFRFCLFLICGPIAFLAREARTLLNGTDSGGKGSAGSETDFGGMGMDAFFNDPSEQRLFLESLFVQAVMDCSAYACAASPLAKESWKQLHSSFYRSVDLNKRYDIRVIAALAYMSIMRSRLATATLRDDTAPFWGPVEDFEEKGTAHGVLERSVQKSSTVLTNALALLAYTREHSVYRYWKNEFDFDALSNWLVEQQDSRRQYENALDSFFASRALFQFVSANAARQARQALLGSLQGNFSIASSPSLSRQFNADELPFSLSVSPSASTMEIETKGEAKLLLGVRVLMEKRRRSRRDPNDVEPVTLSLAQSRTHPNFVLQTVTIISHSQLIRAVQIEHGLFTGFTSRPHLVQILNSSVQFQAGPRVSLSAVHFVLSNLIKEEAIVYTVTLIEPENPYAPTDLAPIAITANHHHLTLGQLIVLPDNLDFGPAIEGVGSLDSLLERVPRPRLRRSKKHRRSKGRHQTEDADKDGQQFSSSGRPPTQSFLTQLDAFYPRTLPTSQLRPPFMQMMVLDRSRQPSPDIIETVCLRNGVCTCAETTCTLRCSSCARLTFREICQNIYSSDGQLQKFGGFKANELGKPSRERPRPVSKRIR
uniref:Alpha-2-macroglobulin domain-containing protein n=1 Tax=Globodera rostochiensis TaxID=31243 RepID=A0A914HH71_GLORO